MTEAPMKTARSPLDRLFFAVATGGWRASDLALYPERLRLHHQALTPEISEALEQIDGKATGLLTHVSLMIAGLGLVAPLVAKSDVEIGIVVFEIGVYLLIAVGCLRCLSVFHANQFGFEGAYVQQLVHHELILRRELYSRCIRAAILFTIVVFLLLPVLYLWHPEQYQ